MAPAECLEHTGVEFSKASNEGDAKSMSRRFRRTTTTKSKGGAYGKGVGLVMSVLLALIVVSLAVWLLRRSARDESTPATPEPGEGVEARLEEEEEEVVGEASTPGEAGEQSTEVRATPAAERKAEDLGVDLSQIAGTGSGGRITVKDVTEAAKQAGPE
jgi:pyruvate/2-oxoglutarate dehydrogenase complex dihydrolipoamide acyltransferase (E2) component